VDVGAGIKLRCVESWPILSPSASCSPGVNAALAVALGSHWPRLWEPSAHCSRGVGSREPDPCHCQSEAIRSGASQTGPQAAIRPPQQYGSSLSVAYLGELQDLSRYNATVMTVCMEQAVRLSCSKVKTLKSPEQSSPEYSLTVYTFIADFSQQHCFRLLRLAPGIPSRHRAER
jgi:hypothetical protein